MHVKPTYNHELVRFLLILYQSRIYKPVIVTKFVGLFCGVAVIIKTNFVNSVRSFIQVVVASK